MSAARIQAWRELPADVRAEVERLTRGDAAGSNRAGARTRAADLLQAMGEPGALVEPRDYVVKSGDRYLEWVDDGDSAPDGWTEVPGARYIWRRRQREATRCTHLEASNRRIETSKRTPADLAPRLVRLRSVAVILAGDLEELEDWRRRLGNVDDELPFGSGPQEVERHIAMLTEIARAALTLGTRGASPSTRSALWQVLAQADLWDPATARPTVKGERLLKGDG